MRKLKRGTSKTKGKIILKCFECGRIIHFSSNCPFSKGLYGDEEEIYKKENKYKKRNKGKNKVKILKNKSLYSKEGSSSFDKYDGSDNDFDRVLFMALDTPNETPKYYEGNYEEEEGEVDLEAKLDSALRDLGRTIKKISYSTKR